MKTRILRAAALLLSLACLILPAAAAGEAVALRGIAEDSVPDANGIGAAAVWNIENETFVYEHNVDAPLAPASLTKLMTAVCAYEVLGGRMDETLTVEYGMIAAASGNQVGYYVGETVTVRDLFGGLLTRGANDCAYLLAYAADGGTDAFVARMNEKAAALGSVDLVTKNALPRSEFLVVLRSIEDFTTGVFFLSTVVAAVVLTLLYFLIRALMRRREGRRGAPRHYRSR